MMVMNKVLWVLVFLLIASFVFTSGSEETPAGMVFVKGGTFMMGTDDDGESDELPIHNVTVDSFDIGKYEVTQREWRAVMGDNPSYYKADNNPVEQVDWYAAAAYCNKRSEKEGLEPCYSGSGDHITCNFAADGYRLPSEAEVAWYEANSGAKPRPVGQKKPNELGIYDMSGNIWEWCWEWYDKDYYKKGPAVNPRGALSGKERSYRGGGCCGRIQFLRSSGRYKLEPSYKHSDMGFRVVKKAPGKVPEGMVRVEGGAFKMGSDEGGNGWGPAHRVTVNSFYIGKYEVTQQELMAVMGNNPSFITGAKNPADCSCWYDAVEYCNKRSRMEGLTPCYSGSGSHITCNFDADGYRLPTEAEWEYAAGGGAQSRNYKFSGGNNPDEVAWDNKNSWRGRTNAVGLKKPNELGIYDMTGHVSEWCWDWYRKSYYKSSPGNNPTGPSSGVRRSRRGGNLYFPAQPNELRSAVKPLNAFPGTGFRVVRTAKKGE
jgi:formylglycine-generating enzyme required for sulfatase activity